MNMKLQAKAIVDNTFWIIERNGEKVGTLRHSNDYVLTVNSKNFRYPDLKSLSTKLDIDFQNNLVRIEPASKKQFDVHGYPCKTTPFNGIFDLKRKLPLYTKTEKSQCFYCAGYYVINFENGWLPSYCPKLITLSRNEHKGPYKTKLEMQEVVKKLSNG
jgi:hypothetical protein